MELLVGIVVNVALIYTAFRLWRFSRKQASAASAAWRRRFGLFFFFLPITLFFVDIVLPDDLMRFLRLLELVNVALNQVMELLLQYARAHLPVVIVFAIKPLIYAFAYTGIGLLIGWPIDLLRKKPAEEGKEGEAGSGATPPSAAGT